VSVVAEALTRLADLGAPLGVALDPIEREASASALVARIGAAVGVQSSDGTLPEDLATLPDAAQRRAVRVAFSGRWPPADALAEAAAALPAGLHDEAVMTWAKRRRFTHTASEYTAIAAMHDGVRRLEAMADAAWRTPMNPTVGQSWALDGLEVAKALPAEPVTMGKTFAEVALLCAAAGFVDDAAKMLEAAITNLGRVTAPGGLAAIYRATLRAAAMLGTATWTQLVEHAHADRSLLRDPAAFREVRVAATLSASRAASSADVVDRVFGVLRDVARRLPEPSLHLLIAAAHATLLALTGGRQLDVPLATVRDLLRRDPLPPSRDLTVFDEERRVDLEHVVVPLALATPHTTVGLADAITRPPDRARWLVTAWPVFVAAGV